MRLAIIPARGGSKRIPRKNIRMFCGKPIIAWSIEAAHASGCFDRVVVSTDDPEIADVAARHGAEAPFVRPAALSDDHAGTIEVVGHAVKWHADKGLSPSLACCLYATAPFLSAKDIALGEKLLASTDAAYAFSATAYPAPIQRAFRLNRDGRVEMFSPAFFQSRSQDLTPAYHDAAQFYWGRVQAWLDEIPMFASSSIPVILPRYRVQDIDTMDDWIRAEAMFNSLRLAKQEPIG